MALGQLLEAHQEFAEPVQPRVSSFYHPSPRRMSAAALRSLGFLATLADMRNVVAPFYCLLGRLPGIALVCTQMLDDGSRATNHPGEYNIKVWTEAAGEMYPADDTISWDLSCAKWIEYFSEANLHWLAWQTPMRATQFDPANFSLPYPVGISRVRADFVWDSRYPWPDSSFQFFVYGDDGQTLLYESETLEANPGYPGPFNTCDLDPTLILTSGTFYVAIAPVSGTGHPTSCGDTSAGGHSWYGEPGNWNLYTPPAGGGDYFISAAAQGNYGVEEGYEPRLRDPSLQITNYPNPVGDQVTLKWQVPNSMPISVNLYDATGRMVRNLYAANDKARVGTLTMDTRSLAAGIYLVRLETAKGSATRKLVIDR